MSSESTLNLIPRPSKDHWKKFTSSLNLVNNPDLLRAPAEMIRMILKEEYEEQVP